MTDENGQWRRRRSRAKEDYTVTLDESTLPEGIAVVDPEDDTPNVKEVEFGPGGRVTVNFFIGEGERNVTSFFDQFVQRLVQRPQLRPDAGARRRSVSRSCSARPASRTSRTARWSPSAPSSPWCSSAAGSRCRCGSASRSRSCSAPSSDCCSGHVLWRPLRRKGLGRRAAHDREHRPLAGAALHLPALHRRQHRPAAGRGGARRSSSIGPIALIACIDVVVDRASRIVAHRRPSRCGYCAPASARRPARSPTTRRSPRHPASTSTASCGSCGSLAAALAGLAGILYAYYRPGIKWDMGAQVLLLMFAAVTLGGLGTAFGALIGSLIVGVLVEVSSLWIPPDLKYAAPSCVLIVILLVPTAGHPRPHARESVRAHHGLASDPQQHGLCRSSARRRSATPSRRSDSRCTSATPACSTSASRASWPSAPTATRSRCSRFGFPWWVGRTRRSRRIGGLRADPRHPDAASARRLPRHRDDRRRRGRAPAVPDDARSTTSPARPTG